MRNRQFDLDTYVRNRVFLLLQPDPSKTLRIGGGDRFFKKKCVCGDSPKMKKGGPNFDRKKALRTFWDYLGVMGSWQELEVILREVFLVNPPLI